MQNYRKIRILFGVPAGDYYSRQFASVAAAMPEAEVYFLAFSWSTGIDIRKSKLRFAHIPWKYEGVQIPQNLPPVAEFTVRGFSQNTIPYSARKAFAALRVFIESEIVRFAPDIVVYGPIDHSICYLMDEIAKARGIPRAGILASFISDHFIVQSQGCGWIDYLKNAKIPDSITGENKISTNTAGPKFRSVHNSKTVWKKQFWIRGFERLIRVLGGGLTFDTLQSLSSLVVSKISPSKWFPNMETLESLDDIQTGCVLVALNQPALTTWESPTWIDLIALALEATPEGVPIVIRPHPSEVARELPKELGKTLCSRGVLISRAGYGPSLTSIIRQSRAVMTINSAVGMEALRWY
ncbi:MAG: hypothetical protein JZU65_20840 [Chlorobium sp.]|nr:hypothetical protein [Chlorobium sp.]